LSVLGLFWVFITEDFYPTSLELILWYALTPIIIFGTTFNLLIKLFWFDTKIGRALDQNSKGFRYLLGLKQS
jgi:hypothetical protein